MTQASPFLNDAPIPHDPRAAGKACRNCGKPTKQEVVPPNDLDAEAAVLSAMLLDASVVDVIVPILKPEQFYSMANRRIFEAMIYLCEVGRPVDILTVKARLIELERLQEVGGAEYLASICDATPAIVNVEDHASIIRDRHQLRVLGLECQKFSARSYIHQGPSKELVDQAGQALFELARDNEQRNFSPIGPKADEVFRRLAEAAARGERLSGIPTGFYRLDGKLGGLHGGDVTLVAARPGMGKTAFILDVAQNVAGRQILPRQGVAIFSMEMPMEQLTQRIICARAGVDLGKMRNGYLHDSDWTNLTQAVADLQGMPIFIDDSSGLSVLAARGKLRKMMADKRREGIEIALCIYDYVQLMQGVGGNREQEIASISRDLKGLAKEMNIPVIALSQLNRQVEGRGAREKRPTLSDLRESGALEQDADNVIFIYRDDYYDHNSDRKGIAELIVAKQRNGPTGRTLCRFEAAYTRFSNLAAGQHDGPEDEDP